MSLNRCDDFNASEGLVIVCQNAVAAYQLRHITQRPRS